MKTWTCGRRRRRSGERGAALIEAAFTIPILLLVAIGIFEFGRAYQTWQVLTNAAREGARIAVLPTPDDAEARALQYMQAGLLPNAGEADIVVNDNYQWLVNGSNVCGSLVTINYPFSFIVLGPIVQMVAPASNLGGDITMIAQAVMRNENSC